MRARPFRLSRRFSRLDLPTFERPTNATCRNPSRGKSRSEKAERTNSTASIFKKFALLPLALLLVGEVAASGCL